MHVTVLHTWLRVSRMEGETETVNPEQESEASFDSRPMCLPEKASIQCYWFCESLDV